LFSIDVDFNFGVTSTGTQLYCHRWCFYLASASRKYTCVCSQVVTMLDSGAIMPGFKSQLRRCRVTVLGKLFTPIVASVHQAAKLVTALLRVARVTVGQAESNGSLPRVYDSCRPQADCQEPGSAPEPCAWLSSMGYLYLFCITQVCVCQCSMACFVALYLIGGFLYMRLMRKAKGLNQIPNYDFWRDFGALQAVSLPLHLSYILYCYMSDLSIPSVLMPAVL